MNPAIRRIVDRTFGWAGLKIIRRTRHPVADLLLGSYQTLRLQPDDLLPINRAHSAAYLWYLIKLHSINFVVDVGANHGQFASDLRRLDYMGDIVSFEPNPECRPSLCERFIKDRKWQLRTEALGAATATAVLNVFTDSSFSSLHRVNAAGTTMFGELVRQTAAYEVPIVALDAALPELLTPESPHSILLKSDTQGNDLEVFRGAGRLLKHVRVVVVESSALSIYDDTPNFHDVWKTLADAGFVLACTTPIGNRKSDCALIEFDSFFVRPINE